MSTTELTPDEAVKILADKLQLSVVRRTILTYEHQELMERAKRSENRRESYYTKDSIAEFYASWKLLHGDYITMLPGFTAVDKMRLTPKFVAYVRHFAMTAEIIGDEDLTTKVSLLENTNYQLDAMNVYLVRGYARIWSHYKKTALAAL